MCLYFLCVLIKGLCDDEYDYVGNNNKQPTVKYIAFMILNFSIPTYKQSYLYPVMCIL